MDAGFFFNEGLKKSKSKDLAGAIEDYSKAIFLSSGMSKQHITTKHPDGSIEHIDVINITEGTANMYFNRASAYFDAGNYEAAVNDYSKFIEYNQQDGEAYFRRATANYCLENDKEAEDDLAIALSLDPKYSKELFLSQFSN
jgi:tetratricopeptide (TPR) repeat protein